MAFLDLPKKHPPFFPQEVFLTVWLYPSPLPVTSSCAKRNESVLFVVLGRHGRQQTWRTTEPPAHTALTLLSGDLRLIPILGSVLDKFHFSPCLRAVV